MIGDAQIFEKTTTFEPYNSAKTKQKKNRWIYFQKQKKKKIF